jgi:hypothetical protein
MPETCELPKKKVVHVELDFDVWAALRKRLIDVNQTVKGYVANLIDDDVAKHGGVEPRRPSAVR